jgi:biotin carboxyl carrier protein
MIYKVKIEGRYFEVELGSLKEKPIVAIVNGSRLEVWPEEGQEQALIYTGSRNAISAEPEPESGHVRSILAPIPGVVSSISVKPGSEVQRGQEVCVLEAMKMKNVIRAPRQGLIGTIHVTLGETVKFHETLVDYAD